MTRYVIASGDELMLTNYVFARPIDIFANQGRWAVRVFRNYGTAARIVSQWGRADIAVVRVWYLRFRR